MKDVSDLIGILETQLCHIIRMATTARFLQEAQPGYIAHSALSASRKAPEEANPSYTYVQGDLSEPNAVIDIFSQVRKALGEPSVVVYNGNSEPLAQLQAISRSQIDTEILNEEIAGAVSLAPKDILSRLTSARSRTISTLIPPACLSLSKRHCSHLQCFLILLLALLSILGMPWTLHHSLESWLWVLERVPQRTWFLLQLLLMRLRDTSECRLCGRSDRINSWQFIDSIMLMKDSLMGNLVAGVLVAKHMLSFTRSFQNARLRGHGYQPLWKERDMLTSCWILMLYFKGVCYTIGNVRSIWSFFIGLAVWFFLQTSYNQFFSLQWRPQQSSHINSQTHAICRC